MEGLPTINLPLEILTLQRSSRILNLEEEKLNYETEIRSLECQTKLYSIDQKYSSKLKTDSNLAVEKK